MTAQLLPTPPPHSPPAPHAQPATATRRGSARLRFAPAPDGRTYLASQYATYPFHLCRLLQFAGDPPGMANLYMMSSAGGLFPGDQLTLHIALDSAARAHVTTQASTIVHAGAHAPAAQHTTLTVGPGAALEYWPDPLILIAGARCRATTEIRLDDDAALLWCDAFLAHDPARRDARFDRYASDTSILDDAGRTIALDRTDITGDALDAVASSCRWPRAVVATAAWAPGPRGPALGQALDAWRGAAPGHVLSGVSALRRDRGVSARLIAPDGAAMRAALDALWRAARVAAGHPAPDRRRK